MGAASGAILGTLVTAAGMFRNPRIDGANETVQNSIGLAAITLVGIGSIFTSK